MVVKEMKEQVKDIIEQLSEEDLEVILPNPQSLFRSSISYTSSRGAMRSTRINFFSRFIL